MSTVMVKKLLGVFMSITVATFITLTLTGCGEQATSSNAGGATNGLQQTVVAQQTTIARLQRPNGFATVLAKETQAAQTNGFATVLAQETREVQSRQTVVPSVQAGASPTVVTNLPTPVPTQAPVSHRMTWSRLASGAATDYLYGVACPSVTTCHAVGAHGEKDARSSNIQNYPLSLVTTNGGRTWGKENSGASDRIGDVLIGVQCPSISACYTSSEENLIWATTDGSVVWNEQRPSRSVTFEGFSGIACPSSSTCFVVVSENGQQNMFAIMATINGGSTWSRKLRTEDGLSTIVCPSVNVCYAAGGSSSILVTMDGGNTWNSKNTSANLAFDRIACPSSSTCFAVEYGYSSKLQNRFGAVTATTNGGSSWKAQVSGITYPELLSIACPDVNMCYAVGKGGTILTTADGGRTWASQSSGITSDLWDVACPSMSICYAVGDKGIILMGSRTASVTIPPTPIPSLSEAQVKQRTLQAVKRAGTYRLRSYDLNAGAALQSIDEVNLQQGDRDQSPDGSYLRYNMYTQGPNGYSSYIRQNGSWQVVSSAYPPYDSLAYFVHSLETGQGPAPWTLDDHMVSLDEVTRAYVLRQTSTTSDTDGNGTYHRTIYVDPITFLPIRYEERYSHNPARSTDWFIRTVYSDYGAAITIQVPAEAGPTTPTASAASSSLPTPSPSDSPTQLAEGFFQAVVAHDLTAVQHYYAPDQQPDSWDQILGYVAGNYNQNTGKLDHVVPNVDGCQGKSYNTTERHAQASGVPVAYVTFTFDISCILAPAGPFDSTMKTENQFLVIFEQSTGRWYIGSVHLIPGL